jgi:hypothetical protein
MICYSKLTRRHESPKHSTLGEMGRHSILDENVQDKMAALEKVETNTWCYYPGDLVSIEGHNIYL